MLQLSWQLSQQDKRWFCERSFQKILSGGKVELFFYDTVPFVQSYHSRKWASSIGRCPPSASCHMFPGSSPCMRLKCNLCTNVCALRATFHRSQLHCSCALKIATSSSRLRRRSVLGACLHCCLCTKRAFFFQGLHAPLAKEHLQACNVPAYSICLG